MVSNAINISPLVNCFFTFEWSTLEAGSTRFRYALVEARGARPQNSCTNLLFTSTLTIILTSNFSLGQLRRS